MYNFTVCIVSLSILFGAVRVSDGSDNTIDEPALSESTAEDGYDCGTLSLYLLLRLQNRAVDFDGLAGSMPRGPRCLHSMKELLEVAQAWGQPLRGVRLPESGYYPDRPMIVYLDRKPHGHYVVVRPAGHSGKLVQILDPSIDPLLIDASTLVASAEWTGLSLVPVSSPFKKWILGLCGTAVLALGYRYRKAILSRVRLKTAYALAWRVNSDGMVR